MKIVEEHWRRPVEHDSMASAVPSAMTRYEDGGELETLRSRIDKLSEIVGRLCDALGLTPEQAEAVLGFGY